MLAALKPVVPSARRGGAPPRRPARGARAVAEQTHTVARGDWLANIAPRYDVSVEELKAANASVLGEDCAIYPGQKLVIPGAPSGGGAMKTVVCLGAAAAAAVFVLLRKK